MKSTDSIVERGMFCFTKLVASYWMEFRSCKSDKDISLYGANILVAAAKIRNRNNIRSR